MIIINYALRNVTSNAVRENVFCLRLSKLVIHSGLFLMHNNVNEYQNQQKPTNYYMISQTLKMAFSKRSKA